MMEKVLKVVRVGVRLIDTATMLAKPYKCTYEYIIILYMIGMAANAKGA